MDNIKLTPEQRAEAQVIIDRIACDENALEQFVYAAVYYRAELYAAPPSPPLTDEEILECLKEADPKTVRLPIGFKLFARAIERRVKGDAT